MQAHGFSFGPGFVHEAHQKVVAADADQYQDHVDGLAPGVEEETGDQQDRIPHPNRPRQVVQDQRDRKEVQ